MYNLFVAVRKESDDYLEQEGAQKRREAEAELGRIEGELKQKLLELRN